MPIYEISSDRSEIRAASETGFAQEGVEERRDLQRLLRDQIDVVAEDTMVLAEEFGNWQESKRRIDLLAIDRSANLVVIELKRTEDGGHMELQAVRYAAMVSAMDFNEAVDAHARYLVECQDDGDARQRILDFLEWEEPNADEFGQDVRIVLVSADFSKELTTAVMWLNDHELDVQCVRLKPYVLDGRLLVDAQTIIPLPEAAEYQIKVHEKARKERQERRAKDYTKYDVTLGDVVHNRQAKRWAIFRVVQGLCSKGITPDQVEEVIPGRRGRLWYDVPGEFDSESFVEYASEQGSTSGRDFHHRRWFVGYDELIHFGDSTYAFTNQWGEETEEALNALVARFPDFGISFCRSD